MKRHAWLIVAFAALFGLRAPLCAWACLASDSPTPLASAEHHSESPSPCHGTTPATPEDVPASEHECDCDSFQTLLTKGDTSKAFRSFEVSAPPVAVVSSLIPQAVETSPGLWKRHRSLPPPNIFLLNSTLLI